MMQHWATPQHYCLSFLSQIRRPELQGYHVAFKKGSCNAEKIRNLGPGSYQAFALWAMATHLNLLHRRHRSASKINADAGLCMQARAALQDLTVESLGACMSQPKASVLRRAELLWEPPNELHI